MKLPSWSIGSWLRCCTMAGALVVSLPGNAATGRITDLATGEPIAGATVYAVWYERLWFSDRIGCGGTAVVQSDADGGYDVGFDMTFHAWFHDAAYWVVAPGYQGGGRYSSKDWSAKLQKLDGLSLDEKLKAVPPHDRYETCVRGVVTPYAGMERFERAIRAAQTAALCDPANGETTPQTDIFVRYFPATAQASFLWKTFVSALMPLRTSHPIPVAARNNACVLASLRDGSGALGGAPAQLDAPLTLQIALTSADSTMPARRMPVRLLWGLRDVQGSVFSIEHRETLPLFDAVAYTDDDGNASFRITQAMLDELDSQQQGKNTLPRPPFVVVPYAPDRIALGWGWNGSSRFCASGDILNLLPQLESRFGYVGPSGVCRVTPGTDGDNAADEQLHEIVRREAEWRVGKGPHQIDESTVRLYAWQWPATALLARAYDLITLPADVENDPEALNRLQRAELGQAFDAVCASPEGVPAMNPRIVLRAFWWLEAQSEGVAAANQRAQERATKWDDGARCTYADGKQTRGAPTRPPNPLTNNVACGVWRGIRERLGDAPSSTAAPLTQMQVDFSKREGACLDKTDFGSSL